MSTNYVVTASMYDLIEQICFFLVRLALYKKPTLLYRCTGTARLPSPKGEMKAVLSTLFISSNAYQIQIQCTEPVLLNVYGAPALIPRNEFRQPV
jgi:hypothetical protein